MMENTVKIKICAWDGCETVVESINKRIGKSYYHCDFHREDRKRHGKTYFEKNRDHQNQVTLANYHKLRQAILDMYGRKCQCCDVDDEVFLALDHVNGGGRKHRQQRGGNYGVYRDALAAYDPDRFRVLCHNCNFAIHKGGTCPHSLAREYSNGQ